MHSYVDIVVLNQFIYKIRGNAIHSLGINDNIIHEGLSLFAIPWEEIFVTTPVLSEEGQVIQTINNHHMYIRIINIPKEFKKDCYIITIFQVDKAKVENNLNGYSNFNQLDSKTSSKKMQKIMQIVDKIANVDSTVLLLGETGVGKTWLAKYIHQTSSRKKKPFISINCSTLPDSLIESELFGYEAGTFTGGNKKGKIGLLEAANNGIVFLDEIGELSLSVQSKLLEVLQDGTFRKVGGSNNIKVDIRIIAATNRDLSKMVENNTFREDLYYRLHVVPLIIPALRDRKEEIIFLAHEFLKTFNEKYARNMEFNHTIIDQLLTYSWPGNIRELENTIERYVVTQTFPDLLISEQANSPNITIHSEQAYSSLKEAKYEFEKQIIIKTYNELGTTYKTAERLGVNQSTIAKKLIQYRKESDIND